MNTTTNRNEHPTVEAIEASIDYMIARLDAEQPNPDQRLLAELGRLTYLKVRLEDKL